jgi:hypothetical protein
MSRTGDHGRAVDAAGAVDQLGDPGDQVGTGDVDEPDDVGEVHAMPTRMGSPVGASAQFGEVGGEDGVDVDPPRASPRPFGTAWAPTLALDRSVANES